MEQINEQWRPIEGYEGQYEVSNMGRVKSLDRIISDGRHRKEMILKLGHSDKGYLKVDLFKEGKGKTILVHRLVAQAFIPNPEGLPQINHRDEDKTNNVVFLKDDGSVDEFRSNLEWCDRKYNCNYGTRNERGSKNMVQTNIRNGRYDPEMCGIWKKDRKEYDRLWHHKNREKINERRRERYRRRKKAS